MKSIVHRETNHASERSGINSKRMMFSSSIGSRGLQQRHPVAVEKYFLAGNQTYHLQVLNLQFNLLSLFRRKTDQSWKSLILNSKYITFFNNIGSRSKPLLLISIKLNLFPTLWLIVKLHYEVFFTFVWKMPFSPVYYKAFF